MNPNPLSIKRRAIVPVGITPSPPVPNPQGYPKGTQPVTGACDYAPAVGREAVRVFVHLVFVVEVFVVLVDILVVFVDVVVRIVKIVIGHTHEPGSVDGLTFSR